MESKRRDTNEFSIQNRNRPTDIEKRHVVTKGEAGGRDKLVGVGD